VKATSWDAPGNQSETTEKTIVRATPTPVFTGGLGSGDEGELLGTADMEVTVGNGWYGISQFNIPAPILYSASALDQNTTAEIVGKAIGKGHNMNVKITYTDGYIANICGINIFCRLTTDNTRYVTESLDHVAVELFRSNGTYVDKLWNDSSDGGFTFIEPLGGKLKVGTELKARVKIYGQFDAGGVTIDYRGVKGSEAKKNKGLSSNWSNEVSIVAYDYSNDIVKAAYDLLEHLIKGPDGWYNNFDDLNAIHPAAKALLYTQAVWNPDVEGNTNYVQCVAFAYMTYVSVGKSKPELDNNPVDWVKKEDGVNYKTQSTNQFDIYANGTSTVLPDEGDFMIWDIPSGIGHVAVVINVNQSTKTVTVAQSNTNRKIEEVGYEIDPDSGEITFTSGKIPINWMHPK
jgi:hypothetical protein